MPSTIGTTLKVTVFGQSHSPAVGCVVEGLPAGFAVDLDALQAFMDRRAPGNGQAGSTARREPDVPSFFSGLNDQGATCGAPLVAVVANTNARSSDYDEIARIPRPGHADFTAWAKWDDARDVAGGGHFSGRLTAPLCVAGGIALQMLAARGVRIAAHLAQVGAAVDEPFDAHSTSSIAQIALARQMDALAKTAADGAVPVIDPHAGALMEREVAAAREAGDSIGGVIECVATGLPAGIGSPMFDGLENTLARALFGIPAVKGVEVGAGFAAAGMRGSEMNDPFTVRDGHVVPATNNAGGILGGISTGAPLLFRVVVKPTPSIGIEQDSVDLSTGQPAVLKVRGRHDACIAPRAVPVVEAVCALALLDSWLSWPAAPVSNQGA